MYKGKIICIRKCSNCGKDVEIRHKERVDRKNIFCNKQCEGAFRREQTIANSDNYYNCECPVCGKKFHLKPSRISRAKNNYCSKECHNIAKQSYMAGTNNHQYGLKGDKNASWKSDRKETSYGYYKIRVPNHPFRDCDDFVFEHRLVAEEYLLTSENSVEIEGKRYLKPEYIVHHIDENKKNNNVNNLRVMTLSEHTRLHHQKK